MGLIERMLKYDKLVYWAPKGKDRVGKTTFENPVEMRCRWEDGATVVRDQNGEEHIYNATVFVGEDLDVEGMLWHGEIIDVPVDEGDGDPSIPPNDANPIKKFEKIPKINYRKFVRKVYL